MKVYWRWILWPAAIVLFGIITSVTGADDRRPNPPDRRPYPPVGIYIQMTEDFYRDLKPDGQGRTISTNMSEEYLHQIAIATRYTVETNLQVLQQQERIIHLLEALQNKTGGAKP
ncbi:MAG: hypothetical protein M0036_02015 [Desulfobacteraceae bacterium]|nr:hypothetical protein [Desulfobacteraceae bacterium]